MSNQNLKIVILAIAFYSYCGLWLYVLYPLLDKFLGTV